VRDRLNRLRPRLRPEDERRDLERELRRQEREEERERRRRARESSSAGSSDETPADYEELAAAFVVMLTRALNWLAAKTRIKRGRDFTATREEALRLGKPIARAIVRYLDLGEAVTVSEKKDLIRAGLAGGSYVERVGSGRPGGSEDADDVIETAFYERPRDVPPPAPRPAEPFTGKPEWQS